MNKYIPTNDDDIVHFDSKTEKDIRKLPQHVLEKLRLWANSINTLGIQKVREYKGFHDEPLKGNRTGQRSIRLSKSYRAIYIEDKNIIRIIVIEVNKHDY